MRTRGRDTGFGMLGHDAGAAATDSAAASPAHALSSFTYSSSLEEVNTYILHHSRDSSPGPEMSF